VPWDGCGDTVCGAARKHQNRYEQSQAPCRRLLSSGTLPMDIVWCPSHVVLQAALCWAAKRRNCSE